MIRLLYILLILIVINSSRMESQINLTGYLGAGYPVATAEEYHSIYQDWKVSIGAGAVLEYHPLSSIIIAPLFSFQYVFFNKFHPGAIFDAYPVNSRGTGSQIYQLGMELVVHKSRDQLFDPQFILGGGYQWVDYGTMTITWKDLNGSIADEIYSPPSLNAWYITVGLGGAFRISSALFLNTTIKSVNTIDYSHSVDSNDWIVSVSVNYRII